MRSARPRVRSLCLRWPSLAIFAVFAATAALIGVVASLPALAQTTWGGTVEVAVSSTATTGSSSLTFNMRPGESRTYWVRLTKAPVYLTGNTLTRTFGANRLT